MRLPSFAAPLAFHFSIGAALLLSSATWAAELHPVETELRRTFPSISVESGATFEAADTFVGGRLTSGLRARFAPIAKERIHAAMRPSPPVRETAKAVESALSVIYPHSYDGLLVAELGAQRVVLRAVGALGAPATESGGKLVYTRPYPSTDVVEVPHAGRSEELLLLHDQRAPLIFEYEIVTTEGVRAVAPSDGAIRFLPELAPLTEPAEVAGGRFTQSMPSLQIDRPWVIDAFGKRTESQAQWTLIGDGPIPRAIRLTVTPERLTFPLVVDPSFSATGSLATQRYGHTATLLPNGKVLIAGGYGTEVTGHFYATGRLASAELYDPAAGTFSRTGALAASRENHTATLLPNGKVLIAGGYDGAGTLSSAELYDPAAGTFSPTGSLACSRYSHTATLLASGKVLIVGDCSSAELYDPATGTFSLTGSLVEFRRQPTATLLPNGKVLIAGGSYGNALASAELYDPVLGTFSSTGSLATPRNSHTATLLPNGKVLIAGGYNTTDIYLASAELYDPAAGTFSSAGSLANWHAGHTATLLPNGKVLITGGSPSLVCELYDPLAGTFSSAGSMASSRNSHTGTLLTNGRVLIAGGFYGTSSTPAELYDAAAGTFSPTGTLAMARNLKRAAKPY